MTVSGLGVKIGVHKIATEFSAFIPHLAMILTIQKVALASPEEIPVIRLHNCPGGIPTISDIKRGYLFFTTKTRVFCLSTYTRASFEAL